MRAHVIEGGEIVNTIEIESLDVLPGLQLADASIGGRIGDGWVDGAPVPAQAAPMVPESISPRQFLQALNKFGLRQQVDNAVSASTDQDLKDWYNRSSEFERYHPEVLSMAQQLGFSSAQIDQVWSYGASI